MYTLQARSCADDQFRCINSTDVLDSHCISRNYVCDRHVLNTPSLHRYAYQYYFHNLEQQEDKLFNTWILCCTIVVKLHMWTTWSNSAFFFLLNRFSDCGDGSDELGCNYTCAPGYFSCLNSTISISPFRGHCLYDFMRWVRKMFKPHKPSQKYILILQKISHKTVENILTEI